MIDGLKKSSSQNMMKTQTIRTMSKKTKMMNIKSHYDNDREDNDGIWFDGEDPDDKEYEPNNCSHIYMDLANGRY